jgi:L-lactate dehydrogenase complex protein LldF
MVTEEIHLNDFLEKNGIDSIESDLGEYIQQLDNEPPYHIVTPAMHKSKEDVARVFHEHLNTARSYARGAHPCCKGKTQEKICRG